VVPFVPTVTPFNISLPPGTQPHSIPINNESSQSNGNCAFEHIAIGYWDMKIGIIGSGDVAKALGGGCLKHGVMLGTRQSAKLADWVKDNTKGHVGSFADAAKFAELAVLAVKGTVAAEAVRAAGAANLAGKICD
jgi:hypothetical protein